MVKHRPGRKLSRLQIYSIKSENTWKFLKQKYVELTDQDTVCVCVRVELDGPEGRDVPRAQRAHEVSLHVLVVDQHQGLGDCEAAGQADVAEPSPLPGGALTHKQHEMWNRASSMDVRYSEGSYSTLLKF